jgi:anti-sigma regulatory factor (Ser/Thr protein kinase)
VVGKVGGGEQVEAALATVPHPADPALDRVLQAVAQGAEDADRRAVAALAGCAGAAARVQAQTTRMLAGLRELEDRYSEETVFADLLDLDHQVSQLDRLADSMALLSGGRSGRRWTRPIVMESILRGALGRIAAYRQVRVHSASVLAVAGAAAEGVMHALAEILDNAASFSAPGSEVQVYVQEEDTGVVILVEDAGLGLRGPERHRAESLVTGSADLSTLPDGRLGLAAVGRLAASYGLTVTFRPSSRGGTAVLLAVPRQLFTHPNRDDPEPPGPGVAPAGPVAAASPAAAASQAAGAGPVAAPDAPSSPKLPKRARGKALLSVARPAELGPAGGPDPDPGAGPPGPAPDPGPRFAAFRQAVHGSAPGATAGPDRDAP